MPGFNVHSDLPKFIQKYTAAPGELNSVLTDAGKEVVSEGLRMLWNTTRTWKHQPVFKPHVSVGGGRLSVNITTDDKIYRYVTEGTPPHTIVARGARVLAFHSGYRSKTSPEMFTSHAGGPFGNMIHAKVVHHPGTRARHFVENIEDRMHTVSQNVVNQHLREWAKGLT